MIESNPAFIILYEAGEMEIYNSPDLTKKDVFNATAGWWCAAIEGTTFMTLSRNPENHYLTRYCGGDRMASTP